MTARQPLAAHCHACGHVWAVLWLPAPAAAIPRRYTCPMCFDRKRIFMAREIDAARIAPPLSAIVPEGSI